MNKEVCVDCGVKHLTKEQKESEGYATTFNKGECCVCKEIKHVTNIRHYNYLKKEIYGNKN